MAKLMGTFHNVETGEVEVRELTADEIAFVEAQEAEQAKQEVEIAARAVKKAALLSKLGITEDEAKLLLG